MASTLLMWKTKWHPDAGHCVARAGHSTKENGSGRRKKMASRRLCAQWKGGVEDPTWKRDATRITATSELAGGDAWREREACDRK